MNTSSEKPKHSTVDTKTSKWIRRCYVQYFEIRFLKWFLISVSCDLKGSGFGRVGVKSSIRLVKLYYSTLYFREYFRETLNFQHVWVTKHFLMKKISGRLILGIILPTCTTCYILDLRFVQNSSCLPVTPGLSRNFHSKYIPAKNCRPAAQSPPRSRWSSQWSRWSPGRSRWRLDDGGCGPRLDPPLCWLLKQETNSPVETRLLRFVKFQYKYILYIYIFCIIMFKFKMTLKSVL